MPSVRSLPADIAAAFEATSAGRGPFGVQWSYVDEAGSTNDLAMRAAEAGAPDGTMIVAGAQTAGRGRLGRTWCSPPGAGLYVSVIVRRTALAPWITLAGGVAVAEGIRAATALPVQIKWPNDVVAVDGAGFRGRRKLAGVLAEASSGPAGVQHIVLGFGINICDAAFPPELASRVSSLETELGRPVDAGAVLAATLVALNCATQEIAGRGGEALLSRWLALAPSARGARIEWDTSSGPRSGLTAGLGADGALLARTDEGVERILSGEVRWI